MRRPLSLAALVLSLALPASALASSSSKPSTGKPGSNQVHVSGYYRKDGTYVPPHDRAAPHSSTATHSSPGATHTGTGTHGCKTCPRDEHGRIQRSQAAKDAFMRQTGYPHGRPGYVIDHIVPLECGGADEPGNMQWQTVAEAKAKDRTEKNCRK